MSGKMPKRSLLSVVFTQVVWCLVSIKIKWSVVLFTAHRDQDCSTTLMVPMIFSSFFVFVIFFFRLECIQK